MKPVVGWLGFWSVPAFLDGNVAGEIQLWYPLLLQRSEDARNLLLPLLPPSA